MNFLYIHSVVGLSLCLNFSAVGAEKSGQAKQSEDLFLQPKVMQISISIPPAGLTALHTRPKTYVTAALEEGGVRYADIKVRLKGNGSFQPLEKKPAFALKFNQAPAQGKFHGHTKVLVNNAVQDRTFLCEALGGELFRAAGVPAPRTTFAQVRCNGRDLGLYVVVEAINKEFLARHFKDPSGNLYEGSNHDVNEKLEVDSGKRAGDQSDLKALAAALKERELTRRFQKLSSLLDVDRFVSFAAVEVLAVHRDGYSLDRNNFRIYHDPATGLMTFIPHGYDQLFQQPNRPLLKTNQWSGLVAHALFETPEGMRLYWQKLRILLEGPFKTTAIEARLQELLGVIRTAAANDPADAKDFEAAAEHLRQNIRKRIEFANDVARKMETQPITGS
jgi:spore coat protein H